MDIATVEPSAEPSQIPAKPKQTPFITKQNAAQLQKLAIAAIKSKREGRLNPPEPLAKPCNEAEKYIAARLTRVRVQLRKLDELIEQELDPQKLDRLVSAQSRLSEQWRIFSGIPLPGSRRPGREKPSPRSTGTGPVDAE